MFFINAETQNMFFEELRFRREKRNIVPIEASYYHREKLDKCLSVIVCHDTDIWSYGTGIMLVAPKIDKITTESEKRAASMRLDAKNEHDYYKYSRSFEDESVGYFVRFTLEIRDRLRNMLYDSQIQGIELLTRSIQAIEYVENNILEEFEHFSIESDFSKRRGTKAYGDEFEYYRYLTKHISEYTLISQIEDDFLLEGNLLQEPLRTAILETFPNILDNENIIRNLSSSQYSEDLTEDLTFFVKELVVSKGECVVCYTEGNILEWPCHSSHVLCEECTIKVCYKDALCPLCRQYLGSF
jgi:hypothetical protein